MKHRDPFWDALKFALIYLVVLGHIVEFWNLNHSHVDIALYNTIFAFHMPLFVFVSGRFSHITDRHRYKIGILRLVETYVVFQLIRYLIPVVVGPTWAWIAQGRDFGWDCIITPNWVLWYLLALVWWRLLVYFVPNSWLANRKVVLSVTVLISLAAGFIPISTQFAFQRTLAFLPFFALGYYSKDFDVKRYVDKIPLAVAIVSIAAVFCVFFFLVDKSMAAVFCARSYYNIPPSSLDMSLSGGRCIFLPLAMVLSVMFMRVVPSNTTLAKWGRATLFIYIYHSFIVGEVLYPLRSLHIIPQDELSLFCYSIATVVVLLLLSKIKILNILLNPVSYWHKKR